LHEEVFGRDAERALGRHLVEVELERPFLPEEEVQRRLHALALRVVHDRDDLAVPEEEEAAALAAAHREKPGLPREHERLREIERREPRQVAREAPVHHGRAVRASEEVVHTRTGPSSATLVPPPPARYCLKCVLFAAFAYASSEVTTRRFSRSRIA